MRPVHYECSGRFNYSADGDDFDCDAAHEELCDNCVCNLSDSVSGYMRYGQCPYRALKYPWYDPITGHRIGIKKLRKEIAQIKDSFIHNL